MKKFGIIILLGIISFNMLAQDSDSGLRFGLTLSPQIAWMSSADKNLDANGSYLGYCYGLMLDVLIPKNYAFATGLIISAEGGSITYEQPTKFRSYGDSIFAAGANVECRTQYVEIPLTMKLMTNQIGYITYFGQFGLQGGVKIRSRADLTNASGFTEEKIDFSDDVTITDMGLLLGGGLEFELTGNTALHTAIQYYNGFIDVTNNPDGYKTKATLNHLRLQLGIYF